MKVSSIKCKLEHKISNIVICGSCMFEYSARIRNPMKSMLHKKGHGSTKGNGTFMSNINCQGIEN
jgi:hypothetical protein